MEAFALAGLASVELDLDSLLSWRESGVDKPLLDGHIHGVHRWVDLDDDLTGAGSVEDVEDHLDIEGASTWGLSWGDIYGIDTAGAAVDNWADAEELTVVDWVEVCVIDDIDEGFDSGVVTDEVADS